MDIAKNKIKDYKKKIAEFQLAKSNYKKPIKYRVEFDNIRLFFSTSKEIFLRFIIIISQVLLGIGIITNGFLISYTLANIIPNAGDIRLAQITFRILTLFLSFIPTLIILFFLLPIIICSRIRSLKIWSIVFIFIGTFIYLIIISSYLIALFFLLKKESIQIKLLILLIPGILIGISLIMLWFSSFSIILLVNKHIKKSERSLFEIYEYNRVKIN